MTHEEEEQLVAALATCSSLAWHCGTEKIVQIVKSHLESMEKTTDFKDNLPGEDWLTSFKRRWHGRIRLRQPEAQTKACAPYLNQKTLGSFFPMYHTLLSENGFLGEDDSADRIFNADETGLSTDPDKRKLFFKKSSRDLYILAPTSGKSMYTVLAWGSASGVYFPPLIVYKSQHLYG